MVQSCNNTKATKAGEAHTSPVLFSRSERYRRAHNIYMMRGVYLDKEGTKAWYFIITSDNGSTYNVSIHKDTMEDNCLCEFGSQWRFDNTIMPRTCSHIIAARIFLERRGVSNAMQGINQR